MAAAFEPVQFGKYRLIQPLAQGGMAEIFLAKQQGPAGYEKTVVIKRILQHWSSNEEFVEMFLDEARLAAQLSHPSIVQIFDFGEVDGSYFLAMEYLRGEDLHSLINIARKSGVAIPSQVAATIVSAAADALHYAHTLTAEDGHPLNIVHRDISPSNIFLTYQGQVKVLDFGIARAEGKVVKTATGVVKGKLAYMSPEQAMGDRIDGRVDVWALGAVLHELLTLERLFWKKTEALSLNALLKEPIPLPGEKVAGVPRELDEVCRRALERDLERRYPDASQMYADLDDYLSSRTYVPAQRLLQQYITEVVGPEVVAQKLKASGSTAQKLDLPGDRPPSKRTSATIGEKGRRNTPMPGETRARMATPAPQSKKRPATRGGPQGESEILPLDPLDAPLQDQNTAGPTIFTPPLPERKGVPVPLVAGGVLAVALLGVLFFFLFKPQPKEQPEVRYTAVKVTDDPGPNVAPVTPPPPAAEARDAGGAVAEAKNPGAEHPPEHPNEPGPEVVRPAKGLLDVNCVPWCSIFIDGKDSGRTSPAMGISLSAGKHHLKLVNPPTGVERDEDVVIHGGETSKKIVKF